MRLLTLVSLCVATVACTRPGPEHPLTYESEVPLVAGGAWVRPPAASSWQWQLLGTVNTGYDVDLYDVDLFDSPDALLDTLHDDGRLVICYFSAGSVEDWREDAGDFPAAAIGRKLRGWAGERWLDVRHPGVLAVMEARLDLAAARGCDLVEPDNVDGYSNGSGFDLSRDDQLVFNRLLADAAHARDLGVLLKNGAEIAGDLEPWFDGAVVEECAEFDECDAWDGMVAADKPVLQAEYTDRDTEAAARELGAQVCPDAVAAGRQALVLPLDLDDAFRVVCE